MNSLTCVLARVSRSCKTPLGYFSVHMNLLKDKEIAGTTMSHTKSNAHSAGVQEQEKYPTEKSIVILGDSIVKHIN